MALRGFVVSLVLGFALAQDRFNYRGTVGNDYGPEDWRSATCLDIETCEVFPDRFDPSISWEIDETNHCRWCPEDDDSACGSHHQSPINLVRNIAVVGDPLEKTCIDVHWMAYFDSTCDFERLQEARAFTVERHALKVTQPIEMVTAEMAAEDDKSVEGTYRLACRNDVGRRWGRIDFSRGFSQWWHLSHVDFHVPSEHTQHGVRYDGEIHLYHWYSVSEEEAGVANEMASVTIFLKSDTGTPDWPILNRLICEWRAEEERTREECGLPSVTTEYPGCFYYQRGHRTDVQEEVTATQSFNGRKLDTQRKPRPLSAHDIIVKNAMHSNRTDYKPMRISLSPEDLEEPDPDFDWDEFLASHMKNEDRHRRLMNYDHVSWFNYFPMPDVRTEYYYRYSGSQTVPPCYGEWFPGNLRAQTNHWRVMKDPIRVSQRQIYEMHRLLKERIAPADAAQMACQPDTAAKPDPVDERKISVARPLQSVRPVHFITFCECENWRSKFEEDQEWCRQEKNDRLFSQPYNFAHSGF